MTGQLLSASDPSRLLVLLRADVLPVSSIGIPQMFLRCVLLKSFIGDELRP